MTHGLSIRRYIPLLLVLLAVVVASLLVVLAVDHQLAARVFASAPDVMSGRH